MSAQASEGLSNTTAVPACPPGPEDEAQEGHTRALWAGTRGCAEGTGTWGGAAPPSGLDWGRHQEHEAGGTSDTPTARRAGPATSTDSRAHGVCAPQ